MEHPLSLQQPVTRRGLGRRLAASAAAAALQQARLSASPQNRNQTPLPAADQAEVDAKYANVIRKYGDRLSDDQKTRIRGVLARHHRMLMRVRDFPIENPDSPATGLRLVPNDTGR